MRAVRVLFSWGVYPLWFLGAGPQGVVVTGEWVNDDGGIVRITGSPLKDMLGV